jgi:NarL family two-component system response regulator LiaR
MRSSLKLPRRHYLLYGLSLAALFFLMKWLEMRYIIIDHAMDIYVGAIALVFTALGIWLAVKLIKPKVETIVVEKEVYIEIPGASHGVSNPFTTDEKALMKTGISNRELEVLQLMATGQSNQEIAGQLFVSLNTVKTHTSNLFIKLDVKRRTQAVDKARKLGLVS